VPAGAFVFMILNLLELRIGVLSMKNKEN
jgi:hypothetical protein